MKNTIQILENHKTIRQFTKDPIPQNTLQELLKAMNHSPSSTNLQGYSLIRITDHQLRKELADIGKQEYLADCPELFVFIVDQYRNYKIGKEQGLELEGSHDMNNFIQGFSDAVIAAQSLVVASESVGLGTVYFGCILNDIPRLIKLLNLPQYTYPVFGLGLGFPNQEPQIKPKLDIELKVFENSYSEPASYLDMIEDYDRILNQYYDLRDLNKRVDTFRDHIVTKQRKSNKKRSNVFKYIESQGFKISSDD